MINVQQKNDSHYIKIYFRIEIVWIFSGTIHRNC